MLPIVSWPDATRGINTSDTPWLRGPSIPGTPNQEEFDAFISPVSSGRKTTCNSSDSDVNLSSEERGPTGSDGGSNPGTQGNVASIEGESENYPYGEGSTKNVHCR